MAYTIPVLSVDFGAGFDSLVTVGYELRDKAGSVVNARTTTNVYEIGDGAYGVDDVSAHDDATTVRWDTGGGSPLYAHGSLAEYRQNRDILEDTDAIDTRLPATPSDFDETADPVELLDTGGTAGTSAAELVVDVEANLSGAHGSGQWDATAIAADIADAVWAEVIAPHIAAGSAAQAIAKIDRVATDTPGAAVVGSLLDRLANKDGGQTYDASTDSLEAISDSTVVIDIPAIADAVWAEVIAPHIAAGSAAEAVAKLDAAATGTPAAVVVGSLLDRLCNKDGSKTYDQTTDALEAIRDRQG